jgi:lipoprotein-anchoring transpeptidase ErfK/SrfK
VLAVAGIALLLQWPRADPADPAEPVEFPADASQIDAPPLSALPPPPAPVQAPARPAPADPAPLPAPAPPRPPRAPRTTDATPSPPPPAAPVAPTAPAVPGDTDALIAQARERLQSGDHQGARVAALAALDTRPGDPGIEAFLSDLAMPLLASQRPMPEKVEYVVQRGDYLGKLAATFNTPVALIAKANNIQGAIIRIGENIRLIDGNNHIFAVQVSKSRNDVLVTLDGKFFKRYRAATGRDSKTPVGTFKISDKIAHPAWHKPGGPPIPYGHPDNLLGTHWLAIDLPGYGLHGTWEPDSIGGQTSDGCIRLLNDDIEELYTILPKGTLVTITE